MRSLLCTIIMMGIFGTTAFAEGGNRQLPEPGFQFYVIPTAGPESAELEIFLKNEGEIPLNFEFPTSQLFEIKVRNSLGEEVYRFSKGRLFLQAFQTVSIEPQKTFQRTVRWNYQSKGKRVPEGEYTVQASFMPIRLNDEPIKNRDNLSSAQKIWIPKENPIFHHVKVEGTKGHYLVRGEAISPKFFYSVEDGHMEYVGEKQLNLTEHNPSFQIDIQIPVDSLPKQGTLLLFLYERNQVNKIINAYPLVLERFK